MPLKKEHFIKRYMTEERRNGVKTPLFVFSCARCQIYGQTFLTKSARDKAAEEHNAS